MVSRLESNNMERKTLAERIREIIEERRTSNSLSSEITSNRAYSFVIDSSRSCALKDLESFASLLDHLPLVFYDKMTGKAEESTDQRYRYGIIPFRKYMEEIFENKMAEFNLSQAELAKRAKQAPSTTSMILSGIRSCKTHTLELMADAINLFPVYLIPKNTGVVPVELYKSHLDQLVDLFRQYVLIKDSEIQPDDLRRAIDYGERIAEWTEALRVRYAALTSPHKK